MMRVDDVNEQAVRQTEQAATYADLFVEHRAEVYPFFSRLARATANAYERPETMKALELDPDLRPATAVWWPTEGEDT